MGNVIASETRYAYNSAGVAAGATTEHRERIIQTSQHTPQHTYHGSSYFFTLTTTPAQLAPTIQNTYGMELVD